MKSRNKKILLLLTAIAMSFPAGMVGAVTTNLNATATFLAALVLTPTSMQFGKVIYSAAPSVAGDFVKLGTNSAETFGGVFSANGGATVAAGDVAITGTYGNTVNVACSTTATMTNGSGAKINVTGIEVAKESATAAFGSGTACGGVGVNVLSWSLTLTTDDNLKVGGKIDGTTSVAWAAGSFSTANAGGSNIQIDIVYN